MSEAINDDRLLSRKEAASYLGVSEATLASWAFSGANDLPYIKVGRLTKYRLSDLERWLAERVRTSTE